MKFNILEELSEILLLHLNKSIDIPIEDQEDIDCVVVKGVYLDSSLKLIITCNDRNIEVIDIEELSDNNLEILLNRIKSIER